MKKKWAAIAAAFLLMTGTACEAGSVEGTVKGPLDLKLDLVVRDSGTGNWDRGESGVGVSIGGPKKKTDHTIEIQLISKKADLKSLSEAELVAWYKDGIAPDGADVFLGKSDEKGHYSFEGIPAGSYYLVLLMPGGGTATGEPERTAASVDFEKFIRNWEMYQLFTIGMKVYAIHSVDVSEDGVTHFDYNFAAPGLTERAKTKEEK